MRALSKLLAHPATQGLDLDAPETTAQRREIVRSKAFLRAIYREWYEAIIQRLPPPPGAVLELGSGAGFLKEALPEVITSDLLPLPGVDRVIDARALPFEDGALRALAMTNVLHHVPEVRRFLAECQRCLRPGGRVIMIEPWNTWWSRLVYAQLHHEPFDPDAAEWTFPESGPLSGANGALPWILASRDRATLEREFPRLGVQEVHPIMPLRYLASGGISLRSLQPGWAHGLWRAAEALGGPLSRCCAMFAVIVIERSKADGGP
jgi:SAM-dependent methyltransferase